MPYVNAVKLKWEPVTKDQAGKTISGVGYNVYRDGVKLNPSPVPDVEFSEDLVDQAATVSYSVSAFKGVEGSLSSPIKIDPISVPATPRVEVTVTIKVI